MVAFIRNLDAFKEWAQERRQDEIRKLELKKKSSNWKFSATISNLPQMIRSKAQDRWTTTRSDAFQRVSPQKSHYDDPLLNAWQRSRKRPAPDQEKTGYEHVAFDRESWRCFIRPRDRCSRSSDRGTRC